MTGWTKPNSDVRGRCGVAERAAGWALEQELQVLPRPKKCGSAGKGYWLYEIERAGSDRSELLPWNLPGRVL